MRVTDIQAVTRQKYRVEIEGGQAFVLYKGELSRYSIERGKEIPADVYEEIVNQVLVKRAKLRALHLLQKMDRTKADLTKKLRQGGYPEKAVEEAVAYVESFHYLDDARYASMYLESRKNREGRARIKRELLQKGISSEMIEEAFQKAGEETDSKAVIRELLQKKRKPGVPLEEKEKRRLYGFFMRRGFSAGDVRSVLKEAETQEDIEVF